MAQQYLSTDPRAGTPAPASGRYLSTDPRAGREPESASAITGPYLSTDPRAGDLGTSPVDDASDRRSLFARGVDAATTPLLPQLGEIATRAADQIDVAPNATSRRGGLIQALLGVPDIARGLMNAPIETMRGAAAGVVEGAGQVASQLTSPLDAGLTLVGLRAARSAAPLVSKALDVAGNTALAARGAERMIDADSSSDAGVGLLQAALGAAGGRAAMGRPSIARLPAGRVEAQAPVVGASPAARPLPALAAPAGDLSRRPRLIRELQRIDLVPVSRGRDTAAGGDTSAVQRLGDAAPLTGRGPALSPAALHAVRVEHLPAVRNGLVTREQAIGMRWLLKDLEEFQFQQGGSTRMQRREAYEQSTDPGANAFVPAPHVAGTPIQDVFAAAGVEATRPELASRIASFLEGRARRPSDAAVVAMHYADALGQAWDGHAFDWSKVQPQTLQALGVRRGSDLKAPWIPAEAAVAGQSDDLIQRFAPTMTRTSDPMQRVRSVTATRGEISDPLQGVDPLLNRMPEDLRGGIRQVLEQNQGFADQRRGVQSHELTDQLAQRLAVDASRTLPAGTALNAENLRAYANAVATTGERIKSIGDKVAAARATDADLVALEAAKAEHAAVLASLMGARAEAGRALSSFRMFAKVLDTGDPNLIRAALKAPGVRSGAEDLAKQLAAIGDDPLARYTFLRDQARPSIGDKVRNYYYANILSGIKTHERNFLGNAFNALTNLATVPATAAVDAVRSRATGQLRTAYLGELPHQVLGGLVGTQRGLRDFVFTLQHGISPRNLAGTVDAATSRGAFDLPRVEFGGGGANPFNWPGRMLEATDAFFRSIARNQEWYGLAFAQAKREGLSGQALADRIAALKVEDSPVAKAIDQQADAFSTRAVFQEESGAVARWLQQGAQRFPALSFVVPFIKTPANILRQGAEFSPAGAAMQAARQPGRQGSQAQARVALGTALVAPLAWLAATGRLSGSGPQDSAERAGKMEAGWRPNSVKLPLSAGIAQQLASVGGIEPSPDGEYWVSYSLFQPVSVPASVIANAFESWQAQNGKAPPSPSTIATAVMRTARSVLDQSYLSGLFDVLEAIDNPDQWASRFLARTAHSLTPLAGAQRSAQQALDPTVRQPKGFAESFAANVPSLSQQVPPRIDRFGEEITRPGNALARAADPFNVSPVVAHPVAQELQRLGVDLSLPNPRIDVASGRPLTREEEQQVKQTRGRAVHQQLAALLEMPAYQRLGDDQKRATLLRVIERARAGATRQLRGALQ